MTAALFALILKYSLAYGVDPRLVVSIVENESSFNTNAIGVAGEIGLMQLMPRYFPKYSQAELLNPKTNLRLGIKHLAESLRQCKHQVDFTGIICYNLGVAGGAKVKHPKKFQYYQRVMKIYSTIPTKARNLKINFPDAQQ